MSSGGPAARDDRWLRDAAASIEAAAAALEACPTSAFEATLSASLGQIAGVFDVAAVGEATGRAGDGATWLADDADRGELATIIEVLDAGAPLADGPFSVMAISGRPALGVPNPPDGFAHSFVVLASSPRGFTAEETSLLSLLAATVSSARRRVMATRLLELRLETQEFLNAISALAATDDADVVGQILRRAHNFFGASGVAAWKFDGHEAVLSGHSTQPELIGAQRVPLLGTQLARLGDGSPVEAPVANFAGSHAFSAPRSGEALVVALHGPGGVEGALSIARGPGRPWSEIEKASAESIARSVQKVTDRQRSTRTVTASVEAERMLREVASLAGAAGHDDEPRVVETALGRLVAHFGLRGATLWRLDPKSERYELVVGRSADGGSRHEHGSVPIDFDADRLDRTGFVVIDSHQPCPVEHPEDEVATELVVGLNQQSPRAAVLCLAGEHDRVWSDTEINATRTVGSLLDQALARFAAERRMQRQLELEGLVRRVAGWAVDARVDTVDAILERILVEVVDFFHVTEAQIWRVENGEMQLRRSYRPDGQSGPVGLRAPFDPGRSIARRGWATMRLGDVAPLWGGEIHDPSESRLLATAYADGEATRGLVLLVDPSCRWWDDDELAAIQSIADTVGQLRTRLEFARELERQRSIRELLNASAAAFVDATTETVNAVMFDAVDALRQHLGCHSVAVFELDTATLKLECSVEATIDGQPVQAPYAPIDRDDPIVARILDPKTGPQYRFADLVGLPDGIDQTSMLIADSARGRDILLLSAAQRFGEAFAPGAEAAIAALAGLLAQLCSRMLLERSAEVRSGADRLLADIAADFVERSSDDAEVGVHHALERIASLFGLRTASMWRGNGLEGLEPVVTWSRERYADAVRERRKLSPVGRLAGLLRTAPDQVHVFEPGHHAPDPSVANHTVVFAPIVDDGEIIGALSTTDDRPLHMVRDIEILRDVIEAVAALVRQLWRRLEADAAIGRKLASEDLLRQFATRLVSSGPDADGSEALGWLAGQFGIDHASMWRVQRVGATVSAEPRLVYNASGPLVPADIDPLQFEDLTTWDPAALGVTDFSIDLDRPGIRDLRELLALAGPRRVAFAIESDGSQLFYTRPGDEPIPEHVRATMTTALAILAQHAAKSVAERAFARAFSAAPIAICMRDRDSNLISCNAAYAELTGRAEADLTGTPLALVLSPEQVDEILAETATAEPGTEIHRETAYRRPDGSIVWARVRTTSVEVPGRADPVLFTYCEDITESRRARQLLEYQATHDELTGLPNRRAFVGAVSDELNHSRDCAVLILDLDRFKLVNDSLGHSAGDMLLITCADRIRLSIRPGDTVCRLGGDEFAILLRAPADRGAAAAVADRLLRLLAEPVRIGEEEVFPSASIGIAIPEPDDAVEDLLRHADAAMYQAKAQGRDRSVHFDRSMRDAVVERIRTETDLRRAIENGQLEVHYQPEFVLDSGQIVGAEALLRWRHPERGLLAAGAFIALVEETGLVVDVGRWVLGQATMQAAQWIRDGFDIVMRVNLSARQLRSAIVGEVQQALSAAALAPERLCLELTETAIMDDVQESARILQEFRDLGVQVAIDDFGTGFSSLAYLKRFPVDILKIDRTFVDGVGVDPDDTAIVRSVIGLARTLRLEVVAEGIEDPTQIAELVRLGCNRGQGFHLARPAPAADVAMLLAGSPD